MGGTKTRTTEDMASVKCQAYGFTYKNNAIYTVRTILADEAWEKRQNMNGGLTWKVFLTQCEQVKRTRLARNVKIWMVGWRKIVNYAVQMHHADD